MTPSVLEGAIRSGCTHLILDVLLTRSELQRLLAPERVAAAVQHLRRRACWPSRPSPPNCLVRRALLPPSSIPGAQHFLASCSYPAPLPTLLPRLQAQLGQELVVATPPAPPAGGGPAGEPAGLPAAHTQLLMSLQAAQALPPLVLQGPIATTASAAGGASACCPLLARAMEGRQAWRPHYSAATTGDTWSWQCHPLRRRRGRSRRCTAATAATTARLMPPSPPMKTTTTCHRRWRRGRLCWRSGRRRHALPRAGGSTSLSWPAVSCMQGREGFREGMAPTCLALRAYAVCLLPAPAAQLLCHM